MNKINSHICSIISEKKRPTKPSDKVETEDIKPKETNEKKSEPVPRPVHTKKRRKKIKKRIPLKLQSKYLLYFTFTIAFQATNHSQNTITSRITSSHAKQSKTLVSPLFSVDPSFPTESKAGQLVI